MRTAVIVTTYDRPVALARSLPQIVALGWPVLVVDDGTPVDNALVGMAHARAAGADFMHLPTNRGLACALNIGLAYWLADASIDWISVFQDDVDVHPQCRRAIERVQHPERVPILTCHDAAEHMAISDPESINGVRVTRKKNCRATHIHASREYWESVMPIPTRELGAPKRVRGAERGMGSNVDYWIVSKAPKARGEVVCIPGLVRTFYHKAEDSCWDNEVKLGEDGPLHDGALHG